MTPDDTKPYIMHVVVKPNTADSMKTAIKRKIWIPGMKLSTIQLVPRLSPHMNTNQKERGEPGKIYHMRNAIHFMDRIYLFRCESIMVDRTRLDCSTLHYLAARQAMASVYRPMHSYSPGKLTAGEWLSRHF